jgi:hypothetical protein
VRLLNYGSKARIPSKTPKTAAPRVSNRPESPHIGRSAGAAFGDFKNWGAREEAETTAWGRPTETAGRAACGSPSWSRRGEG